MLIQFESSVLKAKSARQTSHLKIGTSNKTTKLRKKKKKHKKKRNKLTPEGKVWHDQQRLVFFGGCFRCCFVLCSSRLCGVPMSAVGLDTLRNALRSMLLV